MITRPVYNSEADAKAWAMLRARLWPDADSAALLTEAQAFLSGVAVPAIAYAFVAEDGDPPAAVGFIEISIRPFADGCESQPVAHVEGWYVEPSSRKLGIGRALMNCAEAWAREHGFTELASDTQSGNVASLAAHSHCGFAEMERLVKLRKAL